MGNTIVMGINMNKNMRTSSLAEKLKAIGLKDAVFLTNLFASPPATLNHNHNQEVIERFFTSIDVEVVHAGFLFFDSD